MKRTFVVWWILLFLLPACSDSTGNHGGECGDPKLPGRIQFSVASLGVGEGEGVAELPVQRTVGCAGEVRVGYAAQAGTALQGEDYRLEPGWLEWEDGKAQNQVIQVEILDDDVIEGDKSLEVELYLDRGDDQLGEPSSLSLTILEDDISGPPPFRVADINTVGTDSSYPSWFSYPEGPPVLEGLAYFSADDGVHGHELWVSDGTPEGTRMVKDLNPGPEGSRPDNILLVFDRIYFHAEVPGNTNLWKTDGTEAGTVPVDVPSEELVDPYGRNAAIGDLRFFVRDTGLWISDGTPAGTSELKEFSSAPSWLTVFGGELVFVADDGQSGSELWKSDGTVAGTSLAVDLAAAEASSSPDRLVVFNGLLLFNADAGSGRQAFRSDGSQPGTQAILSPTHGDIRLSERTAVAGGLLYFTYGAFSSYTELWKTDGTDESTVVVYEIGPTTQGSDPTQLTPWGDLLYFSANDHVHGFELWVTDGSEAGTRMVKDIHPDGDAGPSALQVVGEWLVFGASDQLHSPGLWRTDGSEAGTVKIADIGVSTEASLLLGGQMLMTARDDEHGIELWRSDGTTEGTVLVMDINPVPLGSNPTPMAVMGSTLCFGVDDGLRELALWASDGTEAGTRRVHGSYFSDTIGPVAVGDQVFFNAWEDESGVELFVSDGTSAGTHMVEDINPDPFRGANPEFLTAMGGLLYFSADDDVINDNRLGRELWVSDGTEAGTHIVVDLNPGTVSSHPSQLTVLNGLLFMAASGPDGDELYQSDGSEAGTQQVIDLNPGYSSSNPDLLTPVGTRLAFVADDASGPGVWISDGTAPGTLRVYSGETEAIAAAGDNLCLVVGDSLYVSAGQADDASELYTPPDWGSIALLAPLDQRLLFYVRGDAVELWITDGSPDGTMMLKQVRPDYAHDQSRDHGLMNGVLYFAAADGVLGEELWRTDGTPEGTYRLADINEGPGSSSPAGFAVMDGTLYFSAHDLECGRELWGYREQ